MNCYKLYYNKGIAFGLIYFFSSLLFLFFLILTSFYIFGLPDEVSTFPIFVQIPLLIFIVLFGYYFNYFFNVTIGRKVFIQITFEEAYDLLKEGKKFYNGKISFFSREKYSFKEYLVYFKPLPSGGITSDWPVPWSSKEHLSHSKSTFFIFLILFVIIYFILAPFDLLKGYAIPISFSLAIGTIIHGILMLNNFTEKELDKWRRRSISELLMYKNPDIRKIGEFLDEIY